jgi:hypothetical protein
MGVPTSCFEVPSPNNVKGKPVRPTRGMRGEGGSQDKSTRGAGPMHGL